MSSDRLASRPLPRVDYRLLIADSDELAAAHQTVAAAQARLRQANIRHDPAKPEREKELRAAKRAVARAAKQLDGCWEKIPLTALPPADFEQLKAAHPPTPEQREAEPDVEYNRETFRPALLAACDASGRTAEDWRLRLANNFSAGERQEIWATALAINEGSRVVESVVLPKGSIGTLGSLLNLR